MGGIAHLDDIPSQVFGADRAYGISLWNDLALCSDHAYFIEVEQLDHYSYLIFWLRVNNDTDLEASILEYDR